MKMKKVIALFLAAILALSTLAGCGGGKAASTGASAKAADTDKLIVYSAGAFAGQWDPAAHTIMANIHVEFNTYDQFIRWDGVANEYKPMLATEWKWLDDGYTLQMKLREGVKFHDGSDFNAEDAKASIEYMTSKESTHWGNYGVSLLVDIVDDYTVNVYPEDKIPTATLLPGMATDPVLSKDDIDSGWIKTNEGQNGTGPYKFAKYENDTVYFERFDDYWGDKANFKYCEYKYVSEPSTRLSAVQSGDAQFIENVEIDQIALLEKDEKVTLVTMDVDENKWMIFKCTQPPMDNPDLRKAIAYAIDYETIVNDILQGVAKLPESYASHTSNTFAPCELPTYNPELAKEYLAKAGYPNGEGLPTLKYITSTGFYPKTKEYGEYITSNLQAIGIPIEFVVEEAAAWEAHLYEEDSCHMCDTGWMAGGIDANSAVWLLFQNPGMCSYYDDPVLGEKIIKQGQFLDSAERIKYIQDDVEPYLNETMSSVPILDSVRAFAYDKNLQGVNILPNTNIRFAEFHY